jgi:hypothetical protein
MYLQNVMFIYLDNDSIWAIPDKVGWIKSIWLSRGTSNLDNVIHGECKRNDCMAQMIKTWLGLDMAT